MTYDSGVFMYASVCVLMMGWCDRGGYDGWPRQPVSASEALLWHSSRINGIAQSCVCVSAVNRWNLRRSWIYADSRIDTPSTHIPIMNYCSRHCPSVCPSVSLSVCLYMSLFVSFCVLLKLPTARLPWSSIYTQLSLFVLYRAVTSVCLIFTISLGQLIDLYSTMSLAD